MQEIPKGAPVAAHADSVAVNGRRFAVKPFGAVDLEAKDTIPDRQEILTERFASSHYVRELLGARLHDAIKREYSQPRGR